MELTRKTVLPRHLIYRLAGQSKFNVVGNSGGSEAPFNSGSSILVNLAVDDGTGNAPTCLSGSGTTGETNHLNLGACSTSLGAIQFTESN